MRTGVGSTPFKSRLLLLLLVFVGSGAAVTLVAIVDTAPAVFEVEAVKPSLAEPPMATGCPAGLLCVKNQPTPMPPPIAIKRRSPAIQTHVERRVEPLSVFLSQALAETDVKGTEAER